MKVSRLLGVVIVGAIAVSRGDAFGQSVTPSKESPGVSDRSVTEDQSHKVGRPEGQNPGGTTPLPEIRRSSAVYLIAGLGTPVGVVGLEWVSRIGSSFEISGGLGAGLDAAYSEPNPPLAHYLQWSVMPRLILGNENGGLTFGAGVSGGNDGNSNFLCFDDSCSGPYPVSYFVSGNFEIGGEGWTPWGLAMRAFVGYSHGWCVSSSCVWGTTNIPYLGFGVGYAF